MSKLKLKMNKGFLQISFAWLFALIVGAFILFLAIFFAAKLINTEKTISDAATAKDIGVLLSPLETGFESGGKTLLDLPAETRIYARCIDDEALGRQGIKVSEFSLGKWSDTNPEISIKNRYVFSENPSEGKKFYILTLPFEFPFKVADLTLIIPKDKNYCFVKPSEDFFKLFRDLNFENVANVSNVGECLEGSEKFCFETPCVNATTIHKMSGYVSKEKDMHFETDSLMYAAVFSDSNDYECQVKRLMARIKSLANLYKSKADFVSDVGCRSNINLAGFVQKAAAAKDNPSLIHLLSQDAENMKNSNERSSCPLW